MALILNRQILSSDNRTTSLRDQQSDRSLIFKHYCHTKQSETILDIMRIKIKTETGAILFVQVDPTDSIETIKWKIRDKTSIDVDKQNLILDGKRLDDACSVDELVKTKNQNARGSVVSPRRPRHDGVRNMKGNPQPVVPKKLDYDFWVDYVYSFTKITQENLTSMT